MGGRYRFRSYKKTEAALRHSWEGGGMVEMRDRGLQEAVVAHVQEGALGRTAPLKGGGRRLTAGRELPWGGKQFARLMMNSQPA